MSVKLRLARKGTTKRPFFWIVAADTRKPRDGRYLEKLGIYNPAANPRVLDANTERINHWLDQGAVPSDAVRELLRDMGVLRARAGEAPAEQPAEAAAE